MCGWVACLLSTINIQYDSEDTLVYWGVCLVVSSSGFNAAAIGNVVIKMGDGGRREVSVVSSLVYVCVLRQQQ